jgi:hydrogenase maturation protease
MNSEQIMILGVGCILLCDEGFGVRVAEKLMTDYDFPENVSVIDGGVLGINLMGTISEADHLIVIDVIRNNGKPGDVYRLSGDEIPARIRAKNSLHQIDFLEALTLCQVFDKVPETVIIGIEPEDITTYTVDLTPTIAEKTDVVMEMVFEELKRLGVSYRKKDKGETAHVSCHSV